VIAKIKFHSAIPVRLCYKNKRSTTSGQSNFSKATLNPLTLLRLWRLHWRFHRPTDTWAVHWQHAWKL